MNTLYCADLFCGAGGTSSGLVNACRELGRSVNLLAINHWTLAIDTHRLNYPWARHLCESLDSVDPRKVAATGKLDLLVASPECTHHSIARGGKPCSDQSRASAWHILRWAEALRIDSILIENVKEFATWGPLGARRRPLKSKRGATFRGFIAALESLNYAVDYRTLNAADYGDATTRERLFIIARRGGKPIHWPEPSHVPSVNDRFRHLQQWRAAMEVIDWAMPSRSIFHRKKPLVAATMERINAGLKRFNSAPFLVKYYGHGNVCPVSAPIDTITARDRFGLVQVDGVQHDIRFRMLQPHELARAMSFPDSYQFAGNREEKVTQIGNAVPVRLATALCKELLC